MAIAPVTTCHDQDEENKRETKPRRVEITRNKLLRPLLATDFSQQAYEDTTTVLPVLLCDAHFSLSFVLKSSFLLFDSVIFVAFLNSTFDIVQKKQCQRLVYDANKGLLPRILQRKRRKRRRGCDSFLLFFPFFLLRDGSDSS